MYIVHCTHTIFVHTVYRAKVLLVRFFLPLAHAIVYTNVGSLSFTNVIATQKGTMKCKRS